MLRMFFDRNLLHFSFVMNVSFSVFGFFDVASMFSWYRCWGEDFVNRLEDGRFR